MLADAELARLMLTPLSDDEALLGELRLQRRTRAAVLVTEKRPQSKAV